MAPKNKFTKEEMTAAALRVVRARGIAGLTANLYGARDNLTDMETISDFARKFHAELTVMLDGEHWFHTGEQLQFLNAWILNGQTQTKKEENNDA